jgi:hypothetical protein
LNSLEILKLNGTNSFNFASKALIDCSNKSNLTVRRCVGASADYLVPPPETPEGKALQHVLQSPGNVFEDEPESVELPQLMLPSPRETFDDELES